MTYLTNTDLLDKRNGLTATVKEVIITKDQRELFVLLYENGRWARMYEAKIEKHFVECASIGDNVVFVDFNDKIRKAV